MLRTIFSLIAGLFVTMLVITGVELLSMKLYPAPAGFDWTDKQALADFVANMSMPAMLLIVSGWCLGAFLGAAVPAWQADHRRTAALLIGLLVAVATIVNARKVAHPQWMLIAGTAGPILLAWLATRWVRARILPPAPPSEWPEQSSSR